MSKSMLFFIAVLIVALGARPVLAGDGREYVGATSGSTAPNIGFTAMHDLCHADFPRAHMLVIGYLSPRGCWRGSTRYRRVGPPLIGQPPRTEISPRP